jgi:glutathionyl-hydroquinone reductase
VTVELGAPRPPADGTTAGRFVRGPYVFTDRLGSAAAPAVSGRYHLYVSWACPWAHRAAIVRELAGLGTVVTLSAVDPIRDERGWRFDRQAHHERDGHGPDPVNDFSFLAEAYKATDPGYDGRVTVPALWDRERGQLVSNEFRTIDRQLATAFAGHVGGGVDLYPLQLRAEIDALDDVLYPSVNDGVYRAGFATTQAAYEEAFDALFDMLDWLDDRLARRRYLAGATLTLADVRLFTTLVRFDAVYHGHFKCNRRRLVDYPHLWDYARALYQTPGFGTTTRFDHIKRHYYGTHPQLNPSGIVPKGPAIDWDRPHQRA